MIDRGRWFFPNTEIDDHGNDKEIGYKGYRHEVLDGLVRAYNLVSIIDYRNGANNFSTRNQLTLAKRHFVGRVQQVLDPGRRDGEWKRINTAAK